MHISSIGASVRRWHESNFGRGCLGRLGPKSFGVAQKKNDRGWNFGVGETYDFMNFYYDSMKLYWFKLWF